MERGIDYDFAHHSIQVQADKDGCTVFEVPEPYWGNTVKILAMSERDAIERSHQLTKGALERIGIYDDHDDEVEPCSDDDEDD